MVKVTHFRSLLIVAVFAASAFAQKVPTAAEVTAAGVFSGQEYSNPILGFTMLAPGGWSFFSAADNKQLVDKFVENADPTIAEEAMNTSVLFQAKPPAYAGRQDNSALFSCGSERLKKPSTTAKYIEFNKTLILGTSSVKVTVPVHNVTYGNATFAEFDVEGTGPGGKYRQRFAATVRNGIALFFAITFYDDRQEQAVTASLKSIKLK